MADDRFVMVVSLVNMDGLVDHIGIKGELTDEQVDVLLSAADECPTDHFGCGEVPEMSEHEKVRSALAMLNRPYYEGDKHDQALCKEQMVKLTTVNWPRYPVLTTTFVDWS